MGEPVSTDLKKTDKLVEITRKRMVWGIVSFIFFGGLLGMLVSLFTVEFVERTSDAKFCGSCHSMEPMTKSYHLSVHGGNNKDGTVATCVDCHLPHDGTVSYMVQKTKSGIHDLLMENFGDLESIDWQAKRKESERYVYDSACLKCHKKLQDTATGNHKHTFCEYYSF
ncbi:hypothetical protein BVY04_02275 [bacterium M21]|nr:hypothetical protein BVY04_02275 [bacterium M21]